jgi:O-antigen/teichoic acid export membrane protein
LAKFIAYIKSFLQDEKSFFRDTSIILSGKVFIALLALIITPILTRLFDPEAYGVFALYNSIILNLVILGTLALPAALNTAKKELLAKLFWLILLIIGTFTLLLTFASYFLKSALSEIWDLPGTISAYWYFIPLGFLLTAASQSLSAVQLRLKEFKLTTRVNVTESIMAKASNLLYGYLQLGGIGLILSDLIAKIIGSTLLIIKLPRQLVKRGQVDRQSLKFTLKSVKDYPLFVMPAQWASILSTQLILWFLAYQFSSAELGKYVIALSLLNIPLHILSNSFQPVITQRFVAARDGSQKEFSMLKLLGLLALISVVVFGTLFIIPQAWFVHFLGDKWQGVGLIIKILCGWNLVLFIDQSINNGFVVFNKQRQKLYLNLVDVGLQVGLLVGASVFSLDLFQLLIIFVILKIVISYTRIAYLRVVSIRSTK